MKFLIVGYGSIGRRHFRNLQALGEKDILFYRTNRGTVSDEEIKDYPIETDLEQALAHRPDGAIIANPTAYHLEVANPAVEAGCHILLEKPVSHSMGKVEAFKDSVIRNHVRVLVGYQYRFHPGLRKVASLIKSRAVGEPLSVHVHWGEYLPGWHPWEDYKKSYSARADLGGGVVLTLSHPLDYLRWIFGEIESVFGMTSSNSSLDIDVDDVAEITLKFVNGVIGHVSLDYIQRPPTHNLEIIGTQGTIRWDNSDGAVHVYSAHGGTNAMWEVYPAPKGFSRNDMFREQMKHFIKVVKGKEIPLCSLDDGVRALEIALAVHESTRTQRMVKVII
ncbi:MAG TPA: Gfo/Idh/MocA family oxidoreductase [Anaerolineae bacterium]|nr:Gfo/Idh/MocA family oxidoreductase [Anaerolineae bacterium]